MFISIQFNPDKAPGEASTSEQLKSPPRGKDAAYEEKLVSDVVIDYNQLYEVTLIGPGLRFHVHVMVKRII